MRFKFYIFFIAFEVLCSFVFSSPVKAIGWKAHVVKVADGDTVTVTFTGERPDFCKEKERVRLIGINSTEMNFGKKIPPEAYAEESKEYARSLLFDKDVILSFDSVSDVKDRYGRLLCYIWIDGKLYNELIVRNGLAYYYNKFSFDSRYMKRLNYAERLARFEGIGLWSNKDVQ